MFEGIITPIVTPFNRDTEQSINYAATEQLIEHLIKEGVDGIFPLGSNGEFHVLTFDEKIEFIARVVEIVNGRVPVYAGTGACSTKEAITLSKKAEELGVSAVSVITPYLIPPTQDELYGYYKEIAQAIKIPMILYNIPKTTGCNLNKETVKKLAKIDNIKGIKDSSGDLENLRGYIEAAEEIGLRVLVGSDSKISEGYSLGASGAIAGTSNVITKVIVKLNKALKQGDLKTSEQLQMDIEIIRKSLRLGTVPSVLKRAIELSGIAEVGPARLPVMELDEKKDQSICDMLKKYNLV